MKHIKICELATKSGIRGIYNIYNVLRLFTFDIDIIN